MGLQPIRIVGKGDFMTELLIAFSATALTIGAIVAMNRKEKVLVPVRVKKNQRK